MLIDSGKSGVGKRRDVKVDLSVCRSVDRSIRNNLIERSIRNSPIETALYKPIKGETDKRRVSNLRHLFIYLYDTIDFLGVHRSFVSREIDSPKNTIAFLKGGSVGLVLSKVCMG
jgi:hypothetical protein